MTRIGLISDTHGSLPRKACEALEGCDHVIHAGDIGAAAVIYELEAIAPVTAILGNCDAGDYGLGLLDYARCEFDGVRILVAHRPKDLRNLLAGQAPAAGMAGMAGMASMAGMPLPQIAIHGHTHTPRQERIGATLWLCPGSPSITRGSAASVMILEVDKGKLQSVELREV
jgi:putative phosphoesterase